jgi:VanZ family protein
VTAPPAPPAWRRHLWWLAAAGLAAAIWWLSGRPIAVPIATPRHLDKLVHAVIWAILAALLTAGGRARGWPRGTAIAVGVTLAIAYGAVDELHQARVPGRDASLGDVAADAVGALAGALAVAAGYGRRRHGDRA